MLLWKIIWVSKNKLPLRDKASWQYGGKKGMDILPNKATNQMWQGAFPGKKT